METKFNDLGLSADVLAAVEEMGYITPTPVQEQTIPLVLELKDVVGAAQTGTGKTAAFVLPIMDMLRQRTDAFYEEWREHLRKCEEADKRNAQKREEEAKKAGKDEKSEKEGKPSKKKRRKKKKAPKRKGPFALIITPTRELAQQIDDVSTVVAKHTNLRVLTVVGGKKYGPQIEGIQKGIDVLVATPGRLIDLMNQKAVDLSKVEFLVLDEADRMLDMGFWPSVRKIVAAVPEERQTLLFSATLSKDIMNTTHSLLKDPEFVEISQKGETADTVEQYVMPVSQTQKNDLLKALLEEKSGTRILVFTRTKRRADICARHLKKASFRVDSIHADKTQAQRTRALEDFKRGKLDILIATDVLARGIDVSEINYVVNFDVPLNPEDYVHRIGRTGRAGEAGMAFTFVAVDEITSFREIEYFTKTIIDVYDIEGFPYSDNRIVPKPDRSPERGRTATGKRKMAFSGSRQRRGGYPSRGRRR